MKILFDVVEDNTEIGENVTDLILFSGIAPKVFLYRHMLDVTDMLLEVEEGIHSSDLIHFGRGKR